MSLIRRRGGGRRKVATILTTAGALLAFQALAVIGAGAAFGAGTCGYNPATDTINVTITSGTTSTLDVDPANGNIRFDGVPCGSANVSNTVAVIVLGTPGTNEGFTILNADDAEFPSSIAWSIDLGTGTDTLTIQGADGTDDEFVVTDTSFTMNGGAGELLGVEVISLLGGGGDDVLDGSALSTSVFLVANGGAGDDWIAPGNADGDVVTGGVDSDTLSYETRTASVAVVNGVDAGLDANADGDNNDVGDEEDAIDCFETVVTGSGNDTIDDGACGPSTYAPGDGDDDITGDVDDTIDWSTSSAAMTIDPATGTATGQGTDTFSGPTSFIGSDFDDVLLWDGTTTFFSGGDGTDTVDASADTGGVSIDLDALDPDPGDDLEVAIGGSGPDDLTGNDIRNTLRGGEGDDALDGDEGNDTLMGGPGNDDFTGGAGADRVSFAESAAGVNVDLSLGFASGEGDDEFTDQIEVIVGSSHDDTITGGPFAGGGTVNFLFTGGAGDDVLTGFAGNDSLRGGAGRDVLRGVAGDDTLRAGSGNDRLFGGSGVDVGRGGKGKDVCRGVEVKSSCGSKKHPKAPVTRQRL